MKDKHSNIHLRPYALTSLALAFLFTTVAFVALIIKGETSANLLNSFSFGISAIICAGSAVAGASLHDKHYLSTIVRFTAFITLVTATAAVIINAIAIWDIFTLPLLWNIAAILTVITVVGGAFSVLIPLYIQSQAKHYIISIVVVATIVSSFVCLLITIGYILQLAFIPQSLYPRLIAATAAPTVLGLLLLPIIIHFLHIRDHIRETR